ncbi:MAG: glycosyl transferase [Mycobacterium sp.]|jgi:UDP:flavonoid glycosyltransferase YjiC (YdhE family)|nr:glycosyl transferase [Mycobacterium sp.]
MKFALAVHGSRGDVEPFAAAALELLRRGHEVRIAVPPNMVGFVESAGLAAVAFGPDSREMHEEDFVRNFWNIQTPIRVVRAGKEYLSRVWAEMGTTLTSLADGADLLLTGMIQQGLAANVAEYYGIPVAALHCFPVRVNGQLFPFLPSPLIRSAISSLWWLHWRMTKEAEDTQRRELGLPNATAPSTRRIVERGSLEIQAYDKLYFPGLAAEWSEWDGRRPFVGALTMELPTDADNEVASWIAAGTSPLYFGFGSMPVQSAADTVAMISTACTQLGQRALICSGANDFSSIPHSDHVKVVRAVNHAALFPSCRAVVHHGGAGTTAAGMRAGIPTLILWVTADQPIWAAQVKRLKVGSARRFSTTTQESLVAGLRRILAPQYGTRAREIATRMTKPAESVTAVADLLEDTASLSGFG